MGYLRARIARLEQENAALLKKHGRIRRQLKIKYPQRPITAAYAQKRGHTADGLVFLFPFQRPQRRLQRPQPPKRRKNGMFSSLRSRLPAARAVWGFLRGR